MTPTAEGFTSAVTQLANVMLVCSRTRELLVLRSSLCLTQQHMSQFGKVDWGGLGNLAVRGTTHAQNLLNDCKASSSDVPKPN